MISLFVLVIISAKPNIF